MVFLAQLWILLKRRLGFTQKITDYCIQCGACGEDGCCKTQMCVGGFFCAGYYGPTRRGPVEELVRLRLQADDWADRLTPKRVDSADASNEIDLFGAPLPSGVRLETHDEVRARLHAEVRAVAYPGDEDE
jgi:hypothetical protein